jgi:hypothetical protein
LLTQRALRRAAHIPPTSLLRKFRHAALPERDLSPRVAHRMIEVMPATVPAKLDCPLPSPSRQTTYARTLHRACLILGGVAALARHLGVSEAALRNWLEGRDDPPQMVFLAAIEIILLHLDQAGEA